MESSKGGGGLRIHEKKQRMSYLLIENIIKLVGDNVYDLGCPRVSSDAAQDQARALNPTPIRHVKHIKNNLKK